jgi:hypothetical protein
MAKDVLHVVPHEQAWAVKREGNERASSTHPTQKDAIEAARDLAKERDDIVIHRPDGTIRERVTYTGSNGNGGAHETEVRPAVRDARELETEDLAGVRTRVRWEAVLAGAVVALAAFFALTLLALAITSSVSDGVPDRTTAITTAVLSAAILFASLFYGGYIASRLTAGERPMEGIIYGVLVWGATLLLLGVGARAGVGAAASAVGPGRATVVAPSAAPSADTLKRELALNDQQAAKYAALTGESRGVDVSPRSAAWWAFLGVVLSLLSAMAGGWFGTGAQLQLRVVDARRTNDGDIRTTTVEPRPA